MPPKCEQLRAWQIAHEVALLVFRETDSWPAAERWGLTAHVRKTATSIPSNLAEGCGKRGPAELRRFAGIAIGSYCETEYQFRLARDLGIFPPDRHSSLQARLDELGTCLYGLVRSLDR